MSATPSTMLALGTRMPAFRLPDANGAIVSSEACAGRPVLVAFICRHCPFVRHIRREFARFTSEFLARGLPTFAINANDVEAFPEDGPEGMKQEAGEAGYTFPYLYDPTQSVARAYRAACTPDFFLFDRGRRLVYRGQLDASRPGNGIPVTGKDLRAALDAVLAGKAPSLLQTPSMGCNIKWKRGNEPEYFAR